MEAAADALHEYVNGDRGSERWERQVCLCGKKRRVYCSECLRFVGTPSDVTVPRLSLPFKLDILLDDHRHKATGLHAKLLAPDDVKVVNYGEDQLPRYNPSTTLVLFPSQESIFIDEVADIDRYETLVLVDCRWTALRVTNEPNLKTLQFVKLREAPAKSIFWRYHNAGDGCLSSIEALYYAFKELSSADSIRKDYASNPLKQGLILPMEDLAKHLQQWRRQHHGRTPGAPIPADIPAHLIESKSPHSRRNKKKDRKPPPTKQPRTKKPRPTDSETKDEPPLEGEQSS